MKLHRDKKPFRVLKKWSEDGITYVQYEADFWHGPDIPEDRGGYETIKSTVSSKFWRNSVSRSVSFWPELSKQLGVT